MLMVTLEIAKQGNTCDPAYAEMEKYFAEKGITSISIDEMIAHWKALKRRDWALWLYRNKGVFEELTKQQIPQEDVDRYKVDYEYLAQEQVVAYIVNNVKYKTMAEAETARQQNLALLKDSVEPLVTCNLEVLHENTDSTWLAIDLDNFVPPENSQYRIKVFNPANGLYTDCSTLQEAIVKRDEFIVLTADHMHASAKIYEVKQHPDFTDDV